MLCRYKKNLHSQWLLLSRTVELDYWIALRRDKIHDLLMTGRSISSPTSSRSLKPSMSGIWTSLITRSNMSLFSRSIFSAIAAWFVVVTGKTKQKLLFQVNSCWRYRKASATTTIHPKPPPPQKKKNCSMHFFYQQRHHKSRSCKQFTTRHLCSCMQHI